MSPRSFCKISRVLHPVASPVQFGPFVNFLKLAERPGLESHFWVTVLGVECSFCCSVWARSSHESGSTRGCGPDFLSPGQTGRRAWSTQSLTESPVWCPGTQAGVPLRRLEPRAQEVKREGRGHMTLVSEQAATSLRPLAS